MKITTILSIAAMLMFTGAIQANAAPAVASSYDAADALVMGDKLLAGGHYAEALGYFQSIGAQSVDNGLKTREPYRLSGMANAMLHLGQFTEAENTAAKALDLNMALEGAWYTMGMAQEYQHRHQEAIATFTMGMTAMQSVGKSTSTLEANRMFLQAQASEQTKGDTQVSSTTSF